MEFALTNGAVKELCELCPDHDIEKVAELFETEDMVERLNNMERFICILSKWGTKKATGSFDGALTLDDVDLMDLNEIGELFNEAMGTFRKDAKPSTEVKSAKKPKATPKN